MRTIVFLCAFLSPTIAFAGVVHGTVLVEGPTGEWVKIPDGWPVQAELRSQVAEPRFAEVRAGEFAFENVPEGGGYEVWIDPPDGLDSYPVQNLCVSTGVTEVEARLEIHAYDERICVPCRGPLNGQVLDSDGGAGKKLPVTLLLGDKELARTRTRRNGKFRFSDVPDLRILTIEIVREGLPVYRSTFRRDPSQAKDDRFFTLTDCALPTGQPN